MKKWPFLLVLLLTVSGAYSYGFPSPTIHYGVTVLVHVFAGIALVVVLFSQLRRNLRDGPLGTRIGTGLLVMGGLAGIILLGTGALRAYQPVLWTHIALSLAGVTWVAAARLRTTKNFQFGSVLPYGLMALAAVLLSGLLWFVREPGWQQRYQIRNPLLAPASVEEEGEGPAGKFFPSSARTAHGGLIEARFFMESEACRRCHADIYQQWYSSAHHFASFNNQWYRKSVEYMQEVVGPTPSKWCGGCHDPALLFSGLMDTPIRETVNRPEAQAGIGCVGCHSIVAVNSTMGQGDYVLEYPSLHRLVATENPLLRSLHDFVLKLNPEPHRRTFLKPFVRRQSAEFCSACHKVHLDRSVNHYRWFRGFNEYDSWQTSGVSGLGARAFYYPAQSQTCVDCHMPLAPSRDAGHISGFVHSHRFPAANTAVPVANADAIQLEETKKFLWNDIVSVDIFALASGLAPAAEEADQTASPGYVGESLQAPLDRIEPFVRPGDSVRIDVVVRNRKVGHSFPGGTTDAFDVWLELVATNEAGEVLFWSGRVEDSGRGPVEKGAHFYRTLLVDAHSNPINKRNAWAGRALVYQRLLPPGAADTVRYRLRIPPKARKEIRLTARLHYRKFSWWNTQFSYAGIRDPRQPKPGVTPDYDDGRWVFAGDTSTVSGKLKYPPDLPIVTVAEDEVVLRVLPPAANPPAPHLALEGPDWERWNDYGIGLLLQGDWGRAEAAFSNAVEIDGGRADGWSNIGRVRLEKGDLTGAQKVLKQALALAPGLAPAHFYYARVLRAEGRLDEAVQHLEQVLAQYPHDRVVRQEIGHIFFLQQRYVEAIQQFEHTLRIDTEDLQAHYNLMLCYAALGQEARAREHEQRYLRFKTDELAPATTGPYLRLHPVDNNERQLIHEHESVPLRATSHAATSSGDAGQPATRR